MDTLKYQGVGLYQVVKITPQVTVRIVTLDGNHGVDTSKKQAKEVMWMIDASNTTRHS